jgi:N6-adenosine-specific RNA methylase IME4
LTKPSYHREDKKQRRTPAIPPDFEYGVLQNDAQAYLRKGQYQKAINAYLELLDKLIKKQKESGILGGRPKKEKEETLRADARTVSIPTKKKQKKKRQPTARDLAAKKQGTSRKTADKWKELRNAERDGDEDAKIQWDKINSNAITTNSGYKAWIKNKEKQSAIESVKEEMKTPTGLFHVLVIDPPWQYEKRKEDPSHRGRCLYPTMSTEELMDMKLLAEDNSFLWLWTTNAFMHDAYHLIEKWGFTPKTILTWAKNKMGTGDWLRGKTEHCILAIKGKPIIDLTNQTTLLEAPLREHSRKPDEFYKMVEEICPGRKIDYFSREKREGWEQWGAESGKF